MQKETQEEKINKFDIFPLRQKSGSLLKKELKKRKKKWWRGQKVASKFKEIDLYGEQVSLTYKGDQRYKTMPGAIVSVIVLLTIIAFSIYRCIVFVTKQDPNLSKQSFTRDLDIEGPLYPKDFGFNIAFGLKRPIDPQYGRFVASKVTQQYFYENGEKNRTKIKTQLDIIPCGNAKDQFQGFNVTKRFMYGLPLLLCIKDLSGISLQGDFYSDIFSYTEIRLEKCVNTSAAMSCKSEQEISDYFKFNTVSLALTNSYVDFTDFRQRPLDVPPPDGLFADQYGSVRQYIDDRFFLDIQAERNKKVNIFLKRSQLQLQDDYLQLGQQMKAEFLEIENSHFYDDQVSEKDRYIATIFLRQDQLYNIYNRQIYSVMDLLGDIGGMYGSIFFIGFLMVSFVSHRLFISAILKQLYQVKDFKEDVSGIRGQSPANKQIIKSREQKIKDLEEAPKEEDYGTNRGELQEEDPLSKSSIDILDAIRTREQNKTMKVRFQPDSTDHKNKEQKIVDLKINNGNSFASGPQLRNHDVNVVGAYSIQQNSKSHYLPVKQTKLTFKEKSMKVVKDLDQELKSKTKNFLNPNEVYTIITNLIFRKRFIYTLGDIMHFLLRCLCFRKIKLRKFRGTKEDWQKNVKKHYQYDEGEDKLFDELDVITLLKTMRRVKLLTQTLLTQQQKMVLRFQRKNIIESSSSSGDSDTVNKLDIMNMMESKNPTVRLSVYGKIKKIMNSYKDLELTEVDRKALRGLFVKNLKEFDEEHRERMSKLPLLDRLRSEDADKFVNDTEGQFWNNETSYQEKARIDFVLSQSQKQGIAGKSGTQLSLPSILQQPNQKKKAIKTHVLGSAADPITDFEKNDVLSDDATKHYQNKTNKTQNEKHQTSRVYPILQPQNAERGSKQSISADASSLFLPPIKLGEPSQNMHQNSLQQQQQLDRQESEENLIRNELLFNQQ